MGIRFVIPLQWLRDHREPRASAVTSGDIEYRVLQMKSAERQFTRLVEQRRRRRANETRLGSSGHALGAGIARHDDAVPIEHNDAIGQRVQQRREQTRDFALILKTLTHVSRTPAGDAERGPSANRRCN